MNDEEGPARDPVAEEAERRRRRARIFGDVLPESTRDDRDAENDPRGGQDADAQNDDWLRRNVPPHHG